MPARLSPVRAVAFPGGISGLAPHGARLGSTQYLICTVWVAHKGETAPVVTDALARLPQLGFLLPGPTAAHAVRIGPVGATAA